MIRFILLLVSVTVCTLSVGQTTMKEKKMDAVNEYIHFVNEGVHGMLIVHRLLENYNQELNKYVDLDSYVINNFSNADLPPNIFEDPDNWFYDTSPIEWYNLSVMNKYLAISEKDALEKDVLSIIKTLSSINKLRFEVEKQIAENNLNERAEVVKVYEKLEQGVTFYEDYYQKYKKLSQKLLTVSRSLKPSAEEVQFPKLYNILRKIYMSTRISLDNIRSKDDEKLPKFISDLEDGINELSTYDLSNKGSSRLVSSKVKRSIDDILAQSRSSLTKLKKFYNDGSVPKEFVNHGRYYYYYNSDIINNFNRYGNGIVFEMNRLFDYLEMPVLKFLEMPHYYKVIYPKLISSTDPIAATNPNISATPTDLKARKVRIADRIIEVDSLVFEVGIFDSKIQDGDVISFNFNKDWLLVEEKLSEKPVKLTIKLNETGKNFFILHSDDVGRNPPTTIGLRYSYGGEVKTIKLSSDLNESEMIEIRYKPSGE